MSQTIFTVSAGGTPVMPLLEALDEAVYAAGRNILQLGGYMIFFNLLNLLPGIFSSGWSCLCSALEISGGLSILGIDGLFIRYCCYLQEDFAAWPRPEAVSERPVYL